MNVLDTFNGLSFYAQRRCNDKLSGDVIYDEPKRALFTAGAGDATLVYKHYNYNNC